MSQLVLAALSAALAWSALIVYAMFGGADFGGGVVDLLAGWRLRQHGQQREWHRERQAIAQAMGPVWEANHVWLIFVLVVTWTAFPIVYAAVSTALFIPVTLALIGIVLRGAAFGFRSNYGLQVGLGVAWGHVFDAASVITPFLFGTVAGALASGSIRVYGRPLAVHANYWTTWTTPFALACGLFAVGLCTVLAATYLTVEASAAGDQVLVEVFRQRAIVSGAVTAALGAVAAALAAGEAPTLWRGLIGKALPLSLGAVLIGLGAAAALLLRYYQTARVLVAAEAACILAAWGIAQWPYLIVPDVTIQNAASSAYNLAVLLISSVIGMALLLPSLWYLFRVFKSTTQSRTEGMTVAAFVASLPTVEVSTETATSPDDAGGAPGPDTPLRQRLESMPAFSAVVTRVAGSLRERLSRWRDRPHPPARTE